MAMPAASLPAPLVVIEKGAKHVVGIRSNLPQSARAAVEALPGVRAAHPLVSVPVIFTYAGRRTPIQVMAYDSAGAPRLASGRAIAGPRQLVLDERLARLDGIRVGNEVEVLDRKLTVVGLSADTDIFFSPFAFLTYDELIDLYLESDVPGAMGGAPLLSFLLVEPDPGADVAAIRRAIERQVDGVDVYRPAELAANDVDLGRQFFGAVLNLLIAIAWLASVLAIGLTMYAAVIDRRRDFGVIRALGVGTWGLAKEILIEALRDLRPGVPDRRAARPGGRRDHRGRQPHLPAGHAVPARHRARRRRGAGGRADRRAASRPTASGARARPRVQELGRCGAGPIEAFSTNAPV